jgi:hypothetical protein
MTDWLVATLKSPTTSYAATVLLVMTIILELWLRFTPAAEPYSPALEEGERLLWRGAPIQSVIATLSDIPGTLFAIFWCTLAASAMDAGIRDALRDGFDSGDVPTLLFFLPFVVAGYYVLIGHFFVAAWHRRISSYALTTRHAVVKCGAKIYTFPLYALRDAKIAVASSGVGSLFFTSADTTPSAGSFDLIPDAKYVHELIRKTLEETDRAAIQAATAAATGRPHFS